MDDSQGMNLIDCLANLLHDESYSGLGKWLGLFELMIKLSSSSYLQDYIDIGIVVETAVHFNDVGVVQEHLNLHLTNKLICDLLLMQQFLFYYFKCTNEVCIPLAYQVYPSVFAVPQLFYFSKVIYAHSARLFLSNRAMLKAGIDDRTAFEIKVCAVGSIEEGRRLTSTLIFLFVFLKVGLFCWFFSLDLEKISRCLIQGVTHARSPEIPRGFLLGRNGFFWRFTFVRLIDDETFGEVAARTNVGWGEMSCSILGIPDGRWRLERNEVRRCLQLSWMDELKGEVGVACVMLDGLVGQRLIEGATRVILCEFGTANHVGWLVGVEIG